MRHKDGKRTLPRLDAIQQDQIVMEKIVVEDDSTFRKSEIGGRRLSIHCRLYLADGRRHFHLDGSLAARGLVGGYGQFLVQFHLTGNHVGANSCLTFNEVPGSALGHRELLSSRPLPVFKNGEVPLLDLYRGE